MFLRPIIEVRFYWEAGFTFAGRSGKSSKMKHIASDFENICSSDVEMDENEALPCCQTITHCK